MTSALWGVLEMMTHDDRGEGVKNCQNGGDVICGWPLTQLNIFRFHKKLFFIFSPGHSNEKGAEEIAQVDVMKYHH